VHALLARSLREAEDGLRERSCSRPLLVVHADGGCARVAKTRALDTYASGPAAVVHGAGSILGSRRETSIAMDIGGTTTDIAFVTGTTPRLLAQGEICGHRFGQPLPEVWSLGLGGGSIARRANGNLTLGPESAGGLPGPASFDLGGTDATVTDACLALGFFAPDGFFGGRRRLRADLARRALARLAPEAEPAQTAAVIKETLEEQVAAAIRSHGRGVDLGSASGQKSGHVLGDEAPGRQGATREHSRSYVTEEQRSRPGWIDSQDLSEILTGGTRARILALGGGGGLHAASIAAKLGLHDVDIFPFSAAFGAFGASTLDVVHVYQASLEGQDATSGRLPLGAWYRELVAAARRDVEDEGLAANDLAFELVLEHAAAEPGGIPAISRHAVSATQEFAPLPGGTSPHVAWLRARLALSRRAEPATLAAPPLNAPHTLAARRVRWAIGERERATAVFSLDVLAAETRLPGPCLVESEFATLAVPPGWTFTLEPNGWMHLHA
jgi:N-methylhydantoinase A